MASSAVKPALAPTESSASIFSTAKVRLVLCLLLAAMTVALYNSATHHGFANYDDDRYITTNAHVRAGLSGSTITWAFTSFDEANWHPLTWLSHSLDCELFNLNAVGHHYTSVLFHAANAVLLLLLLVRLTGSTARSLAIAALFAVHPLNVESVAWVAERKSVLAMFFFLLALLAYAWYARRPSVERYVLVGALFAMGLMSKPMVITLPFVLLLLDYWPLGRMRTSLLSQADLAESAAGADQSWWRLVAEKLPLFALSAGSAIVTMFAQRAGGAITFNAAHAPWLRIENALVCYVIYLLKAVWPSRLAVLYPYPHALPLWKAVASAVILAAITFLVVRYREHRYLPVGWFWFLGTMVPMVGLVQVGNQAMADRYAYLPFVGLFVMVVWGVADVAARFAPEQDTARPEAAALPKKSLSVPLLALTGCVVVALGAATVMQLSYWRDDLTLWTHTLAVTQRNFVAENNAGAVLAQQGRTEEAIVHLRAASEIEPGDPVSQLNLGVYAQQHGDLKQAVMRYEAALQLATDTRIRASAFANLGQIYFTQRDYTRARVAFEAAAKLNNPYPIQLGLLAQKTGDWNAAAQFYAYGLSTQPTDVGFLLLEQALRGAGNEKDAVRSHQQAQLHSNDLGRAQQTVDDLLRQ
jgi:protein O-mannosyl-transferase